MILQTLNAAGKPLASPIALDPRRRRLSQVIGRHVDRKRPHMIAIQRARDPLQPIDEAWVVRGRDRAGTVKSWPRRYLPADAVVMVVYLPRGGSGSSSGSRSKSPLSIALGIAGLALVAFAGPLGGLAAGSLFAGSSFAAAAITAGITIGGAALLGLASRSKANKQVTDTTQIYGVAGGGNLPKPGDRIPRGYGRSWMKPDLSQPDFSQYDGDDQILFKRHTLGLGKYRIYQIRAGKQVIWTEAGGFIAPFDDARNAVEFLYGTPSTLVPSNVVAASGIGGLLPRPADNPSYAGPYPINQRGALISRIQVDFQYPQGISVTTTAKDGTTIANRKTGFATHFEFAQIDDGGNIIGPWVSPPGFTDISTEQGQRFATHPLRYSRTADVPPGRYTVRGANLLPDTSQNTGVGYANIDASQWDNAYGFVADQAVRPGVTEIALRIYATKATGAAAFSELEVDAAAIIPVWDGSQWTDQETSKSVWAFLDIMRNQDYGGAVPDDQLDLGTALGYANSLSEFDTFDSTIRGPVSVYEAATTVLLTMRAEPVHLGRYWSLVRDEPKSVRRHVITRRQMLKGSSQVTFDLDTTSGAAHVIGEFDQDGDYRNPNQTTALYGEASLTPTRQRWTGVRTFDHAQHLTRWRAASGAYRTQTTPFGVEMEGRIYKRGDSISVDPWFIDVRKVAGVIDNDGDTLLLDADVPIITGDAIVLRDRSGREWGPLGIAHQGASARQIVLDPVSRAAVESATGVSLTQALSDGRRDMTTILVGPLATLQENYLIRSVKPDGPDRAQVEALIDDPRVWEAIGATPVTPPVGAGGLADPESPHILSFTANPVQIAAGLRCDYAIQPGRGCVTFEVGLSYDNGSHYETIYSGPSIMGSQVLNPVDPTDIMLRARAFGATGLPGAYFTISLPIPAAVIPESLLPNLEEQFDAVDAAIAALAQKGDDALADAQIRLAAAMDLIKATMLGVAKRVDDKIEEFANAAATEATHAYSARRFNKVALDGRVQDNFAAIEKVDEARISDSEAFSATTTSLGARLTTNEGAIVAQSGAIQSLTTQVTNNAGTITAQSQQLTQLNSKITDANTSITGNATAIQGLTTRVTLNEQGISTNSTAITGLQSTLTNLNGTVLGNSGAISQLQTQTTNINGTLTSQAGQITALQSTVNNPTSGNTALSTGLSNLATFTNAVNGNVVSQGNSITALQSTVSNPTSGNTALATGLSNLATFTNAVNGNVNSQASQITTLSTTQDGHTATLTQYGTSINGISLQWGVAFSQDGSTGGLLFEGMRQLNGAVSYTLKLHGDLIVDGSIQARSLAAYQITTDKLTTGQLIVNGQLFNNAATQVAAGTSGGSSASCNLNARGTGAVLIEAFFNGNSASLSSAAPGVFYIYRDGTIIAQVNAAFAPFKPDSGAVQYAVGPMAIGCVDGPGAGNHQYVAYHNNAAGLGGVTIVVSELSK